VKKILALLALLASNLSGQAQLYTPNNAVNATSNPSTLRVGIGKADPATELDVNGGLAVQSNNNITWGGAYGSGVPTLAASTNYGFYFYPTGTTSGMTFRINSLGYVGIGAEPSSQLHLSSNSDHEFKITRLNGGFGFRILRNASSGIFSFQNTDDNSTWGTRIRFDEGDSNWQNLLLNPAEGNVGIGTDNPSEKLHVAGNLLIGNSAASTSGTYYVRMPEGLASINGGNGRNLVITAGSSDNQGAAIGGKLFLRAGSPTAPSNNFGSVILADDGGNVGIGKDNPAWKLDVNGPIATQGQAVIHATSTDIEIGDLSSGDGLRDNLHFLTRDVKRVSIDGNGNVGIGTTSPNEKLTVNGVIYGKEVKIDLNVPGPDYVFEPNYNLPTLTSIESYIKENKHLPEVPSAKEMEKNGVNVGEMEMLLLKKIEELTLYVIELKKENEIEKAENEKQRKEIDALKNRK
jgi:hypothetical protein